MMGQSRLYDMYGFFMRYSNFDKGIFDLIGGLDLDCPLDSRVLDVACGTGVLGLSIANKFGESRLLSTDVNRDLLKGVADNAKRFGVDWSRVSVGYLDITDPYVVDIDGSVVSLEEESFDVVVTGGSIGYSEDYEGTLRGLVGLVKPRGYFVDLEVNRSLYGKAVFKLYDYPLDYLENMVDVIKGEGCSVEEVPLTMRNFPVNLTRDLFVCRKG